MWYSSELTLLIVTVAVFFALIEVGFRVGRHYRGHSDEAARSHIGALQAASLGLLALLLGFTFAMAVARFDARKSLVLEEANSIGTTFLRARFLPPPQQHEAIELLKEYVAARLDFYRAGIDAAGLTEANAHTAALQERLWAIADSVAAADSRSVPVGLFIQSLNDTIDVAEKRRVALENRVPEIVLYLLFAVSLGALGFIAYGAGMTGRRYLGSSAIFALLIALVLTTIIDLDRPRRGLIRVSQDSMLRLLTAVQETR